MKSTALLTALAVLSAAAAAAAQLSVDAVVEPLAGSFRYDFTVHNPGPDDYLLVTILNAPPGDALIPGTLTAPAGFLALYDGGLGLVDFAEDTAFFAAGTSAGLFRFESQSGPDSFFDVFTALNLAGTPFDGRVNLTVVPEPGTVAAGAALALLGGLAVRRRFRRP